MWRTNKLFLFLLLLLALHWRCIDKYNSPYTSPPTGYLVVEGYISGNSPTQYTLSRTIPLPGDSAIPTETGARVQVEGSDNTIYPLTEQSTGTYVADTLALNAATQYRLRITTAEGEQYLSSFVQYKPTPPIDSINWVYNASGVNIYANTHDPTNNVGYYQWNYTETWEYTSAEYSSYLYNDTTNTVTPRPLSQQDFYCWTTQASSTILLGSTAKLSQDVIYEQLLNSIPTGTVRLSYLYSILVRQYALTAAGYNFLSLMQQNTESLGSIFDATPSQLIGNIQCLTNPNESVIGYISAGTVQQQRIFISRSQLPVWDYVFECPEPDIKVPMIPDSLKFYFGEEGYDPVSENAMNKYMANAAGCVDCRLQGGTTQMPSFWPN
jgi:hypothetical protein